MRSEPVGVDLASQPDKCTHCHQELTGPISPHACSACGLPQPLSSSSARDPFIVLQAERLFGLSRDLLQRRFLELSRALHPDRFGTASDEIRGYSVVRMSLINDSYRILLNSDLLREFLWASGAGVLKLVRLESDFELAEQWFEIQEIVSDLEKRDDRLKCLEDFLGDLRRRVTIERTEMTELEQIFNAQKDSNRALEEMYLVHQRLNMLSSMLRDVERLKSKMGLG